MCGNANATPVRTVKIDSLEDLMALPEDQWFYCPGGLNIPIDFSDYDPEAERPRMPSLMAGARRRNARVRARMRAGDFEESATATDRP